MKITRQILSSLALSGLLLIAVDSAPAQTAVKEVTTTTNSAGTISDFGPETITIRSATAPEPVRYTYTKKTTYVDETGAPVSIEMVKSGLPVTVYYAEEGDRMVATRVVVRRGAATATTDAAVNTVGTISEFSPETIVVRTEKSPEPVRYRYSKTTTYVDEAGAPVSIETVKSGLPVTVYYTKTADGMVASKVVVRKATVKQEPLVEVRKTTTTTTTTTTK